MNKVMDLMFMKAKLSPVPEGYLPGDHMACSRNMVELPYSPDGRCPPLPFVLAELDRTLGEDIGDIIFKDPRSDDVRQLPMLVPKSSPAYTPLLKYGKTVMDVPDCVVRIKDLVNAATNGSKLADPPQLATEKDFTRMSRDLYPGLFKWPAEPLRKFSMTPGTSMFWAGAAGAAGAARAAAREAREAVRRGSMSPSRRTLRGASPRSRRCPTGPRGT